MPIDVDLASIIFMEIFGVISFIVAFLFFRQRQKIKSKQKSFADGLNSRVVSERGDGKCFSSEWVMDNVVYKSKKLLSATPLLLVTVTFLIAVFYYVIGPQILAKLVGLGYASVIALMGIAVLFWTDAFQAYSYTSALHEVSLEQLDKQDQSYIELAREALEKAFLRFVSLGLAFVLFGPFIPQIFNGVLYVLLLYTAAFFQASEVLLKVVTVLGVLIVLILPGIMFFLPELLGRIIIRRGKPLAQRVLKRMKS